MHEMSKVKNSNFKIFQEISSKVNFTMSALSIKLTNSVIKLLWKQELFSK